MTVRGSIAFMKRGGEYQIYVENLEPIGLGALQLAFEQLKNASSRRPFRSGAQETAALLPSRIGIITPLAAPPCAMSCAF